MDNNFVENLSVESRFFLCLSFGIALGATLPSTLTAGDKKTAALNFETHVAPILKTYCWSCHGAGGRVGGLDMRNLPLLLEGGKSGPAIVPGKAAESLLYQKLVAGEMPPKKPLQPNVVYSPVPPTPEQRETIRAWIDAGAPARYQDRPLNQSESPPLTEKDRSWWAFRKPTRPEVPRVENADRVRTPIDAFLLRKLEKKGLGFAPEADPVTLVRRVHLDVIGLPPDPQEVDRFLADPSPAAYEDLVDELLESPHYGERWGRHWLDAVGYVDTMGQDNDPGPIPHEGIWRYRDYVIDAINEDIPYDRFLLEQLAGDETVDWRGAEEFTPEIQRRLIATGFLRQAIDNTHSKEQNDGKTRMQVLNDTVQIVATNLLGLTLHCAQCHTHKFDPIPQADYYRFAALFQSAYDPQNWKQGKDRFLADLPPRERKVIDDQNAKLEAEIELKRGKIATLRAPFEKKLFDKKLATLPEAIREDTRKAVSITDGKLSPIEKYLVKKFGPFLKIKPKEFDELCDEATKKELVVLAQRVDKLKGEKVSYGKIRALWDIGEPMTYLFRRGSFETPGPRIEPGVLSVLDDPENPFVIPEVKEGSPSTGRRSALARWLARPEHPLTARVFVNRVWQQYFGRGLVETPDNFGTSGLPPTHPELLDWLALEFAEDGWSLKRLHKLILLSSAYRQASRVSGAGSAFASGAARGSINPEQIDPESIDPDRVDPDNLLLWRMPLRRLESEIIRDSVLTVSGTLCRKRGGKPVPVEPKPDGSVVIRSDVLSSPEAFRRSVYIFARRNYHLTELNVFDQPVIAHNCTRRVASPVVLQSLSMLNGKFILEQAEHFASRVKKLAGDDEKRRIETAFRLALAREPTPEEVLLSRDLLEKQITGFEAEKAPHDPTATEAEKKPTESTASDRALVDLCQMLFNTNEFLYVQ